MIKIKIKIDENKILKRKLDKLIHEHFFSTLGFVEFPNELDPIYNKPYEKIQSQTKTTANS